MNNIHLGDPEAVTINTVYQSEALVRLGGRHRSKNINGQDHALAAQHRSAVVLVAADGVSTYTDGDDRKRHGRNEVGSWLAAEVALRASTRALAQGLAPDCIVDYVALALHRAFCPLWGELGVRRGQIGLSTTLLLAIVTPTWTGIYASGDGYWGVVLPVWDDMAPDTSCIHGEALVDAMRPDAAAVFGSRTGQPVGRLASQEARHDAAAVRAALRPVLLCPQPVLACHVATDGLEDEPEVLDAIRRGPCRARRQVEQLLERPKDSDDLAIAWTCTRTPGLFGESEPRPLAPHGEEVAHV